MANTEVVMIRTKYHGAFRVTEQPTSELITEQGAEITPLELLRRLQAGEPLGGTIYDEYDDDERFMDPLNTVGIEVEDYGIIRDVVETVAQKQKARQEKRQDQQAEPSPTPAPAPERSHPAQEPEPK